MTNLLPLQTNATLSSTSKNESGSDILGGFTGSKIPSFALPESTDPIKLACELSELARILGGEFVPRPANTGHHIFLL